MQEFEPGFSRARGGRDEGPRHLADLAGPLVVVGIVRGQNASERENASVSGLSRSEVLPETRDERGTIAAQAAPQHGGLARRRLLEVLSQVGDLRRIDGQQGEPGVQPGFRPDQGITDDSLQFRVGPATIVLDDRYERRDVGGVGPRSFSRRAFAASASDRPAETTRFQTSTPRAASPTATAASTSASRPCADRPVASSGAAARSSPSGGSGCGCSPIPGPTAGGGSRASPPRSPRAPPAAARPGPGGSRAACASATRGATGRGNRG